MKSTTSQLPVNETPVIKEEPFSWNDNLSELAQEDFKQIQADLPYGICSSIGMALAKLEILEAQGAKVKEK